LVTQIKEDFSNMTKTQQRILIGSIILLGVTLTLTFLQLGRLTIVKQMKEKTLKTFGNIPKDKLLHFFYGAILSFIFLFLIGVNGLWLTVIIAAAKELVYDLYLGKGNPEVLDFVYTCVPAGMFLIMHYMI